MAYQVFISHSSKDKKMADAICGLLEQKGAKCWIAPRDIAPGQNYGAAILDAIYFCSVMVLVFSNEANRSKHVQKEIERAINADCVVMPFRIESVMPSGAMEYFLSTEHWLDAVNPPLEEHVDRLYDAIVAVYGDRPTRTAEPLSGIEATIAAAEFEELAPDEWSRSRSTFLRKLYDLLFGDR